MNKVLYAIGQGLVYVGVRVYMVGTWLMKKGGPARSAERSGALKRR